MKGKLNKKKVIICIILLIALITTPVFGRYIYNSARDLYLKSKNFSFSSDLLTATGRTYRYSNWSGVDDYEIDIQLYSYENELSLFTYDGDGLQYNLTCTVDDPTKATAHIGTTGGASTGGSYIPNATNVKDVKIYVKPTENLNDGDIIKLTVTAKTTVPYEKTITATFNIKVSADQYVTYSIEDDPTSVYATLRLVNTKSETNTITLTYEPSLVLIDVTNENYENRISQTTKNVKETIVNEDGEEVEVNVKYINSITFNMEPEDVTNIRFYKRSIEANYTYPGGTYGSMVVTVTETN